MSCYSGGAVVPVIILWYDDPVATETKINFVFRFDSTQERLNNFGVPAGVPAGNAAQSPIFNR